MPGGGERSRKRSGAWVFRGTRMPVSAVFENLEAGSSIEEIIEQFHVTRDQVQAVLAFAARHRDPRAFLDGLRPPVVFDEIQNTPELLAYVRTVIDTGPRRMGQWLFTGSQEAPLMQGISESMAGRAAILQLLPFSLAETRKVNLLHGRFPEVLARPKARNLWFASYLQTYLERAVRAITNVRDLATFRRFLALLASRHGMILI